MPALRILHLDAGREWRGGQRQVLLLAQQQRQAGDEPLVMAPPDSPLIRRLRTQGLAASAVRVRGVWDLAAVRRVRALLRTWQPDLLHAHDARSHAIAMAALVGKPGTPLVVTRRVAFVPRGRLKYGTRVSRFIAISRAVRDALVKGGVPDARIDVVYSGVPTPTVTAPRDWRSECGWPADSVICGVVGAMTSEKGVERLADIGARLTPAARRHTRIVLLGGQAAGATALAGIPSFRAGFVDAIHDAMAGLDLLWHPSRAEGLGTAVIDAMALGVPPIAFAVGGIPELIEHQRSGILVAPDQTAEFASQASALVLDPLTRHRLAQQGRMRAQLFSVERMAEGTRATYRRVLKPKRRD